MVTKETPPLKILLVEDDVLRVRAFERVLKYQGHSVPRPVRLVWAKSAGAAIGILERDPGDVYAGIMLDHDLDRQNLTCWDGLFNGKDVVKKITEVCDKNTMMLVHSSNVTESPKMQHELEGAGFCTMKASFTAMTTDRWIDWLIEVCEAQD